MATYKYVVLNDGTKWRINGDAELNYGSGPYRQIIEEKVTDNGVSAKSASGTAKAASSSVIANSTNEKTKAQLEAERKEKERKEKIAAINKSKDSEVQYLGESYAGQLAGAKKTMEENMRQLYIAYMQGLKNIPQQTALWGAGGEIESLKHRSRINYEDNRANETRAYSGILAEIEQKYMDDLRELEARYLQRLLNV